MNPRPLDVALVDYGAGNLPSVERALLKLGAKPRRTRSAKLLSSCDAIVLPGVGHFGAMMRALEKQHLVEPLRKSIAAGAPFLGICLGLQGLYTLSDEAPGIAGLNVIRGAVKMLPPNANVPHMGWNQLQRIAGSRLLENLPEKTYFYFAHSFVAPIIEPFTVALSYHADYFTAVAERGKMAGVQFHPEKSGEAGARILANFLEVAR